MVIKGDKIEHVAKKRKAAILLILLSGYEFKQQELLSLLNKDEMIQFIGKKTDNPLLTQNLNPLEKVGILKREKINRTGQGSQTENVVYLLATYDAFYKILIEIFKYYDYFPIDKRFSLKLAHINSRHAKTFINTDLIEVIESDMRNLIEKEFEKIEFNFTEKEGTLILNFIKLSPSALYYLTIDYEKGLTNLLREYYNLSKKNPEIKNEIIKIIKDEIFLNLQLSSIEDIERNITANRPIVYNSVIKFLDNEKYKASMLEKSRTENTLNSNLIKIEKKGN